MRVHKRRAWLDQLAIDLNQQKSFLERQMNYCKEREKEAIAHAPQTWRLDNDRANYWYTWYNKVYEKWREICSLWYRVNSLQHRIYMNQVREEVFCYKKAA